MRIADTPSGWRLSNCLAAASLGLTCLLPSTSPADYVYTGEELVLRATVTYSGESVWAGEGQKHDEHVTCTISGTTKYPLIVDTEGYLGIDSESVTPNYNISVSGSGTWEFKDVGTAQWDYFQTDDFYLMNLNLNTRDGYADFQTWYPPMDALGTDPFGGVMDRGSWGGEALHAAWSAWNSETDGRIHFDPDAPTISASGQGTKTFSLDTLGIKSEGTMQASFSISVAKPKYEVVILPPADLENWIPAAGQDEKTPGNTIGVKVEIRLNDGSEAAAGAGTFEFELSDTSREPGICLNTPRQDKAQDTFDFRFATNNSDLEVFDDGQRAKTTTTNNSYTVFLNSYDYGAYTRLKAYATIDGERYLAHLDGEPGKSELLLPRDDNDNHVADAWEKQNGVFDQNLSGDWDGVEQPADQQTDGDGICLYERYRGFTFQGLHERLSPLNNMSLSMTPMTSSKRWHGDGIRPQVASGSFRVAAPVTSPTTNGLASAPRALASAW